MNDVIKKQLLKRFNERLELINNLRTKGIYDENVLEVMLSIPRELFIPENLEDRAYDDNALPIGENQTISQPFTVAFMTQLLDVKKDNKILEIGTGSGYQSLILSLLGAKVYSVERINILLERAKKIFDLFEVNITTKIDDGSIGWKEFAPYDRIIITAACPEFPNHLVDQLNDNGKLVCPVGDKYLQKMYLGVKKNNNFELKHFYEFKFVPLIGKYGWDE